MLGKNVLLRKLEQEIIRDGACSQLAIGATYMVFGTGNSSAPLVLIGEAPGRKEDETGIPFVGAAGRLLDEMLQSVAMSRADVYITNIVKYRPPNNRDPSPEEKAEFWPYLVREIEIVDPKLIVTLGRHSGAAFIPDLIISRDHGQARQMTLGDKTRTLIPLYHPAAALYNGALRQTLFDDFRRAVAVMV